MFTLDEAIAKVMNPRIKVRDMDLFKDDEIEEGAVGASIVNEMLVAMQTKHEEMRNSNSAFIRARQYLYDTYEFNEDGEYDIPAENVEDLALLHFVNDYRAIHISKIEEAEARYGELEGASKIFEFYEVIKG